MGDPVPDKKAISKKAGAPARAGGGTGPRRGFPRLTAQGIIFGAVTISAGVLGFAIVNNFVILVFCLMTAAFAFSAWYPFFSILRIGLRRRIPLEIFAGRPAEFVLSVRQKSAFLPAYALSIRDLLEWFPAGRAPEAAVLCAAPRRTEHAKYGVRFQRRGVYGGGDCQVRTSFPFGFFSASVRSRAESEFTVFPKLRYVGTGSPGSCMTGMDRPSPERFGGDSEFKRLREYVCGDNPKAIHWKSTAKHGKLMVRDEERYELKRAAIVMDTKQPSLKGRVKGFVAFERAVSLAASAAVMLEEEGYIYRMLTTGGKDGPAVPARGGGHLRAILTTLASVQASPSDPVRDFLCRAGLDRREEIIVIVSDGNSAAEARGCSAGYPSMSVIDSSAAVAGAPFPRLRGGALHGLCGRRPPMTLMKPAGAPPGTGGGHGRPGFARER